MILISGSSSVQPMSIHSPEYCFFISSNVRISSILFFPGEAIAGITPSIGG